MAAQLLLGEYLSTKGILSISGSAVGHNHCTLTSVEKAIETAEPHQRQGKGLDGTAGRRNGLPDEIAKRHP